MTNLSPEFCRKVGEERRRAGLSQSKVAAEVGCKQSALSMFEQGDGTKLNEDVIKKLSEKFGIALEDKKEASVSLSAWVPPSSALTKGFCPNPHCPSNHEYEVAGRRLFMPDRKVADPVGGKFCSLCGEVLEKRCPNCGAPLHDGAVCSLCGEAYVSG